MDKSLENEINREEFFLKSKEYSVSPRRHYNIKLRYKVKKKAKSPRRFVKVFRHQANIDFFIELSNEGYSGVHIGYIMDCDRTSIIALRYRLIKEGYTFSAEKKIFDNRLSLEKKEKVLEKSFVYAPVSVKSNVTEEYFRVSKSKSYADYLLEEKKRAKV